MLCDELRSTKLTPALRSEFDNIAKHQPVFAGDLLSHDGCRELRELGLVMYYDDPEMISTNERGDKHKGGGYVLTEKGTVLKENLKAAHDIICNGILYKPQGCKLTKDFAENGCGMCGKGSLERCVGF